MPTVICQSRSARSACSWLSSCSSCRSPGVRVALENGVEQQSMGQNLMKRLSNYLKKKVQVILQILSPALPFALFDRNVSHVGEMAQYNGKLVFEGIIDCAKACLENNIPVGLGTDTGCPYITHYDMWRELYYFHKYCGVSNRFALYTATKRNAEIAGIDDCVGTIDIGKEADMIVTKDNPLNSLEALRHVSMVITKGKVVENPRVKKMKKLKKL